MRLLGVGGGEGARMSVPVLNADEPVPWTAVLGGLVAGVQSLCQVLPEALGLCT